MKKHRSYKLTPNGVRMPKHHIKWAPALSEDLSSASDPMLFPLAPQMRIHNLNVFLAKTGPLGLGKRAEPIDVDFIDCSEVVSDEN